jgi:hypothetical protein
MKKIICLFFHMDYDDASYSIFRFDDGRVLERTRCKKCGLWWSYWSRPKE